MGEWLWWACVSVFGVSAILQFALTLWFWVELHRKWRTVPELWGIGWLDVVYRLEREFGLTLTAADFQDWTPAAQLGLTAGQLWEVVAGKLRAGDAAVPSDGWTRVVAELSEALNVRTCQIVPESRLYADLGMVPDLD